MKFKKIIINKNKLEFQNIVYIPDVIDLYQKFSRYLSDDYFLQNYASPVEAVIRLIEKTSPFFWVVVDKKSDKFAGFGFLENLVGTKNKFHSAEVTTCFEPSFWGKYTKACAKKFVKYCFKNYGFKKIKAIVFPENYRAREFLAKVGFEKEAVLTGETLKNGRLQDIEVYSILK